MSDPKIKDALDWLFHKAPPDAIGTGSTTDALWHEIQTGEPVKGHWHLQKALDALANLQKRMRNPNVAVADKDVARLAEADLEEALRSGPHPAADDLARTPSLRDALARYQPQALGEPMGVVEGVEATAAEMLGEGAHLGAEVIQDLEAAGEALGPLL